MSWDAHLYDDRGHWEGDWNYTHNCNGMANDALTEDELTAGSVRWWGRHNRADIVAEYESGERSGGSWWACLDRTSGHEGAALLTRIIKTLEAEPDRFRAMNPDNGWGNYDDFLKVLTDMRDRVPENWPTIWETSG